MGWHLEYPEQHATADTVESVHKGKGASVERAVIELHSHNHAQAYFSELDDRDTGGCSFRVYGVIGTIFDESALRWGAALFGHFCEYPAHEFFEMPDGMIDCVEELR